MDESILHCDLNGFYASVECIFRPELRRVPMAVSGNPENRHGIILAKNEPAKKFGIQTAVCSEVDVFKKDTVHGRLDGCTHLAGLYRHGVVLCMEDRSCGCECQSG